MSIATLARMRAAPRSAFAAAALLLSTASAGAAEAGSDRWRDAAYPYSVVSESVHDALVNFGDNAGVRMMVSPHVSGVVQGRREHGTALQFLDEITRTNDLDWYCDGTVIYVSPAAEEQTAIVPLNGASFDVMKKQLEQQKLFDARYRMSRQIGGDAAILSGPPSFVAVMKQAIESRTGTVATPMEASQDLVVLRGSQSSSMKVR